MRLFSKGGSKTPKIRNSHVVFFGIKFAVEINGEFRVSLLRNFTLTLGSEHQIIMIL